MKLRVFVVFHKAIDLRLTMAPFSPAEIDAYFTLYGVNARFADKTIVRLDGQTTAARPDTPGAILEPSLAWHDPDLQARGFCETSCYVHLLKNKLHEPYDYVGVTQYDMVWTDSAATLLRAMAGTTRRSKIVYGAVCGTLMDQAGKFHQAAFPDRVNWDFLLDSYNRFFAKRWTLATLRQKPMTLFQTYLLPRDEFVALASWLEKLAAEVYPWANQPPYGTHWGALAGYMERAECLFIALRLHERKLALGTLPVVDDRSVAGKLGVQREHYGRARPAERH